MSPLPKNATPIVALVCAAAVIASVVTMCRRAGDDGMSFDKQRFQSMAGYAGEEAARFMGEGARVVLFAPDTGQVEFYRVQVDQLEQTLRRNGIKVLGREVTVQSDKGSRYPLWGIGTSGSEIMARTASYEEVDYVVNLIYVPVFTPDDVKQARDEGFPPMVVALAQGHETGIKELVRAGIIQLGILNGFPASRGGPRPTTQEDWFHYRFRVVTPENVGQM